MSWKHALHTCYNHQKLATAEAPEQKNAEKQGPSASCKLDTLLGQLKGHKLWLIQNVTTRWNGQSPMLEELPGMKRPITVELATSTNTSLECPTAEEWKTCNLAKVTLWGYCWLQYREASYAVMSHSNNFWTTWMSTPKLKWVCISSIPP